MIKNLTSMGYKEGFSLGSIPYDFRRFIVTNEFAKIFRFQIENLYNITGKKSNNNSTFIWDFKYIK